MRRRVAVLALVATVAMACNNVQTTLLTTPSQAVAPASVDVYLVGQKLPSEDYETIAVIERSRNTGEDLGDILSAMRAEAAELGAHALVVTRDDDTDQYVSSNGVMVPVDTRKVQGVAVRWRQPRPYDLN